MYHHHHHHHHHHHCYILARLFYRYSHFQAKIPDKITDVENYPGPTTNMIIKKTSSLISATFKMAIRHLLMFLLSPPVLVYTLYSNSTMHQSIIKSPGKEREKGEHVLSSSSNLGGMLSAVYLL